MDVMDVKLILEEQLREAASIGDNDGVEELLKKGVDINTRHSINGWTPLHWACKRGHYDIAALLLKNGADKNVKAANGQSPTSVCTNSKILQLLGVSVENTLGINETRNLGFVPNYIQNIPLNATIDLDYSRKRNSILSATENMSSQLHDLVLKIRIANTGDPDFIEVEMSKNDLSYGALIQVCCKELDIDAGQIIRLRKLPNTKLRRDTDIQRLQNLEEIEVVIDLSKDCRYVQNSNDTSTTLLQLNVPTNSYQSISKKDQIILY